MTFNSCGATCLGAALLLLLPTASWADEQHVYSVRNDTGRFAGCGIRRAGSSAVDNLTLRAGETWTRTYSGSKGRMIRCEGVYSAWQPLAPDHSYGLVKAGEERIVAQPIPPR